MTPNSYLVLGDWGTSVCRLYLCQWQQGSLQVIARSKGSGIKQTNDFEASFSALYQPWRQQFGILPIYLIGAVGSNLGWNLAPYLDCPTDQAHLLQQGLTFRVDDLDIVILPGLRCQNRHGLPDVMRGEETQVFGYLSEQAEPSGQQLICLPGTHTKWVLCENGQVLSFLTSPVGELFDALCQHSALIAPEGDGGWCNSSFESGMTKGLASDSHFLHCLFAVRALQVVQHQSTEQARSFLSGLLVGADVKASMQDFHLFDQVVLIGSAQICHLYASAIHSLGIKTQQLSCERATVAGLQSLMLSSLSQAV